MLLFDIIRDWFVMYIWGGYTSTGSNAGGCMGYLFYLNNDGDIMGDSIFTYGYGFPCGDIYNGIEGEVTTSFISIGDWLSTTSTIIVMVLLCIVFGLMVRWLFRLTSGLLQGKC